MKPIFAAAVLCAVLATITFAAEPTEATGQKTPAEKIRERGIRNATDLEAYLLAVPVWTWEHKATQGETIKFGPNGNATHTVFIAKWNVTGNRTVMVRRSTGETAKLTFSEDYTFYEGLYEKKIAFHGKPVSQ